MNQSITVSHFRNIIGIDIAILDKGERCIERCIIQAVTSIQTCLDSWLKTKIVFIVDRTNPPISIIVQITLGSFDWGRFTTPAGIRQVFGQSYASGSTCSTNGIGTITTLAELQIALDTRIQVKPLTRNIVLGIGMLRQIAYRCRISRYVLFERFHQLESTSIDILRTGRSDKPRAVVNHHEIAFSLTVLDTVVTRAV